jgi:predicted ATPase
MQDLSSAMSTPTDSFTTESRRHIPLFQERTVTRFTCAGRTLLASMTADKLAEHLFDVANQFNRGEAQLIDPDEKVHVAMIDLSAGRKAKASTAYTAARVYFSAGMALIDERAWNSQYELDLPAHPTFEQVEAEYETVWQTLMGARSRA